MARRTYSEELRRDAVELYRSTPGATVVGIPGATVVVVPGDLGIMDSTLSAWLKAVGVAVRGQGPRANTSPPAGGETPAQGVARRLDRAPSTVSREVVRNMGPHDKDRYDGELAHARVRAGPDVHGAAGSRAWTTTTSGAHVLPGGVRSDRPAASVVMALGRP